VGRASKIPGGGGEVKLNYKGMGQLLRDPAIAYELGSRMRRVQAAIPGSELEVTRSGVRARAKVAYGSDFDEANTGTLSRALDLAGGQRGYKKKFNKPRNARKASS
jgi:hypothetical protein